MYGTRRRRSLDRLRPVLVVASGLDDALARLSHDPQTLVRVRWQLCIRNGDGHADAVDALTAFCAQEDDRRYRVLGVTRHTLSDTFHGDTGNVLSHHWLRYRQVLSHAPSTKDEEVLRTNAGDQSTWLLRITRPAPPVCIAAVREEDNDGQPMSLEGTTTITTTDGDPVEWRPHVTPCEWLHVHDEARMLGIVAPQAVAHATDPSAARLPVYARFLTRRTVVDIECHGEANSAHYTAQVVFDTIIFGHEDAMGVPTKAASPRTCHVSAVFNGSDQLRHVARLLHDALGIDMSAPSPHSKVVTYLQCRRPVLYARLVERGTLLLDA